MAILEGPIKGIKEVRNYIDEEWVDSERVEETLKTAWSS
jgi:hypothetical protein